MITRTPDGREIYYQVTGSGPGLLLLHGGVPDYFNPLVDLLSPQYQCIAFDRLGFGRSAHLDRDTTVEEQVTAIAAVHQSVTSAPVWIFGWSSGGNFALAYTLSFPERVKGLVLVEPALYAIYPPEEKPPEVERMLSVAMPLFQRGQAEKGWYEFLDAVFGPQHWASDHSPLTERQLEQVRSFGYDQSVVITWYPSAAELDQLTQPVLILEGDQSPLLLRNICHLLGRQLMNATVLTLEGQDHEMPYAAPKLVAEQVMTFISGCDSKA